jgi:hypothetical protein
VLKSWHWCHGYCRTDFTGGRLSDQSFFYYLEGTSWPQSDNFAGFWSNSPNPIVSKYVAGSFCRKTGFSENSRCEESEHSVRAHCKPHPPAQNFKTLLSYSQNPNAAAFFASKHSGGTVFQWCRCQIRISHPFRSLQYQRALNGPVSRNVSPRCHIVWVAQKFSYALAIFLHWFQLCQCLLIRG